MDETVRHVSYEKTGEVKYNNLQATQKVRITSLSNEALIQWIKENIHMLEYEYLEKNGKTSLDPENKDDVSGVLAYAIAKYSQDGETITNEVTVHFVFSDKKWKIQADPDFTAAVLGGAIHA